MNQVLKKWFEFVSKEDKISRHIITAKTQSEVIYNVLKPIIKQGVIVDILIVRLK